MMLRTCPVCGVEYQANPVRLRHGRQTTCSRTCSYQLRASRKTKRAKMTCSACGGKFERSPSQIKSKHEGVYCSRQCHYAGRSMGITKRIVSEPYQRRSEVDFSSIAAKVWESRRRNGTDRHSEATREKLRLSAARQIAVSGSRQVSRVEDEVAKALTELGIYFTRQVPIRDPETGKFVGLPDFTLSDGSVMEVNGTFWHADPRFFPSGPVYASQIRTAERYASKMAALDRLGIPVYEVWESDVSEDPVNAVRVALSSR